MDAVQVRPFLHPLGNREVHKTDFVDHDLILFHHPLSAHLFAEVTYETEAIEPIEHPSNHLVDIIVTHDGADFERNRFGDNLYGVFDLEQRWCHSAFKLHGHTSDSKNSNSDDENQTDDCR